MQGSRSEFRSVYLETDNILFMTSQIVTIEVAQATRGPNVRNVFLLDQLEDEIVLLLSLNRDGVHAVLAAKITCLQPVNTFGF